MFWSMFLFMEITISFSWIHWIFFITPTKTPHIIFFILVIFVSFFSKWRVDSVWNIAERNQKPSEQIPTNHPHTSIWIWCLLFGDPLSGVHHRPIWQTAAQLPERPITTRDPPDKRPVRIPSGVGLDHPNAADVSAHWLRSRSLSRPFDGSLHRRLCVVFGHCFLRDVRHILAAVACSYRHWYRWSGLCASFFVHLDWFVSTRSPRGGFFTLSVWSLSWWWYCQ